MSREFVWANLWVSLAIALFFKQLYSILLWTIKLYGIFRETSEVQIESRLNLRPKSMGWMGENYSIADIFCTFKRNIPHMESLAFGYLFSLVIAFIIGVLITRWLFGIDKIINSLKQQNELSLMQIRLLKKMLLNQGNSHDELDIVLKEGNKKPSDN